MKFRSRQTMWRADEKRIVSVRAEAQGVTLLFTVTGESMVQLTLSPALAREVADGLLSAADRVPAKEHR